MLAVFFKVSGLYEYKVFGELDCKSDVCHKVYMDLEYRKIWDSYVAGELKIIVSVFLPVLISDLIFWEP